MTAKMILDNKYELGGGIGCWARSRERCSVDIGDVRVIGGVLMKVYTTSNRAWGFHDVSWVPVADTTDYDELRKWARGLVGV